MEKYANCRLHTYHETLWNNHEIRKNEGYVECVLHISQSIFFAFHIISLKSAVFRWNVQGFLQRIKISWKWRKVCAGIFAHFTFFFMKHLEILRTMGNMICVAGQMWKMKKYHKKYRKIVLIHFSFVEFYEHFVAFCDKCTASSTDHCSYSSAIFGWKYFDNSFLHTNNTTRDQLHIKRWNFYKNN